MCYIKFTLNVLFKHISEWYSALVLCFPSLSIFRGYCQHCNSINVVKEIRTQFAASSHFIMGDISNMKKKTGDQHEIKHLLAFKHVYTPLHLFSTTNNDLATLNLTLCEESFASATMFGF